ncbi:MAG: hypothetical protein LBT26_07760 [Clostridiales Family XIII bacterium]|nr:hypothetical protein [Clostridiales Family XIII bacterium]
MPRAVLEFVETKSLLTVPDVQNKIINDYEIIAIEVKTGTRTKSKSLNMFVTKYKPSYSIRISAKNFGFENNIKSVPLHAVFCI